MIDAPGQLRLARARAGVSQRELARRARTSSATLSRYESGRLEPTVATFNRLLAACLPAHRRWPSLAMLAPVAARTLAEAGGPTTWRLTVGEVIDDEQAGSTAAETRMVVADPPLPTGDRRVDALMAALAEWLCLRHQLAPPGWSQDPDRVAEPWWFVAAASAWIATALRESPPSFARRGIFVTATAFERR
ncbi:MAG TPA: helix-turn-helix transcriptional regulator [Candidatus Micrarchaeia archaeon]|nr:helix-turn-helix transcriptional regulator [Candidatus Micrarchaeia archaeon]